ncbi:MAG: hypothetical protein JO257_22485 [Deltaproteobacteria bacterium]|nr:hypothetical protein [Deltaproteobacteria bacterium]
MSTPTHTTFEKPLIPANRAGELLDELLFSRVLENIDITGLQRLEAELWTTLIELDVDCAGRSPMSQARAMITRALVRFIDDPVRTIHACDECIIAVEDRSSAG